MFQFDPSHIMGNPPRGLIVGELVDDPGDYMIEFLDAVSGTLLCSGPVLIDAGRRARITQPITGVPAGAGVQIVDTVARWTGPAGADGNGPQLIKIET